jgi:SRSO17 transposase
VERKTGWLMSEQAGASRPYRMQSLLGRSRWDAEALRDHVRTYVVDAIGDPDGVLVVDETGFLKKGTHSVGVARQYSGTADGSRIARSACSLATQAATAMPSSTGGCICPRTGLQTRRAVLKCRSLDVI